jgi:hypothetical protein
MAIWWNCGRLRFRFSPLKDQDNTPWSQEGRQEMHGLWQWRQSAGCHHVKASLKPGLLAEGFGPAL